MQQVKLKNVAVIALAVLLVLFLWYRFVYSSMQSQASKADQAAADAKIRVQSLESQLRTITGSDAKKKTSADELKAAIPATPELSNFLRRVQQIRDAVGIPAAFQTITPTLPTSIGGTTDITVGITAQGSYAQMMDYVSRLNRLDRLVVIDNVQITAGTGDSAPTQTGGPTGPVFAGQGAPPVLSVQLTARLLTQQAVTATATPGGAAPAAPAPAPAPAK